jgi:DNA helicase II / ATP-dependent DNA helicase PcrA
VGTIDAFLNQFLFLQFGNKYMDYVGGRPNLVGEPYRQWQTPWNINRSAPDDIFKPIFFDRYSLGAKGQPLLVNSAPLAIGNSPIAIPAVSHRNADRIVGMKRYMWSLGYALQADANYIAYAVLVQSASLTRTLVQRFPVFIVDEAQDMTEVQHALLDHLKVNGQEHIVLVGDEYQAIYEWNTARPELFLDKRRDVAGWKAKTIAETFRCSPAICSLLSKMVPDGAPLTPSSIGKNQRYLEPVRVATYDPDRESDDVREAVDEIARILNERQPHDRNEGGIKTLAMLARSNEHVARLQTYFAHTEAMPSSRVTWENQSLTKAYLRVVYFLLRNDPYSAMAAYERLLYDSGVYGSMADMRAMLTREWCGSSGSLVDYRITVFANLKTISATLPAQSDVTISDCGAYCDVTLKGLFPRQLRSIKAECERFGKSAVSQNRLIGSLFAVKDERTYVTHRSHDKVRLLFSTVHGAKGETYDGVLLYTRATTNSCNCKTPSNSWQKIFNHDLAECENKRIVYVALSRAAQVLTILSPERSTSAWTSLTQ